MKFIQDAISEYQAALENKMKLTEKELVLKRDVIKAHDRLNRAKDELRAVEMEMMETINTITV